MDDIDYKAKYEASLEKAKAYDEAKERAKKAIIDCGDNEGRKRMIYGIFPEMNPESEDEKVRKIIADAVFCNYGNQQEYLDVLAWLEMAERADDEGGGGR